ncbi:MAG: CotH kinase family protein [Chlorobi bacterium]|nr:CotH kinase family protein [Chlorobiota bacterium]
MSLLFILSLIPTPLLSSGIVINEVQSANYKTCLDADYEPSDWIELYNSSDSAINLKDYTISDKEDFSVNYKFKDTLIQPGGHLLIYASGSGGEKTGLNIIEASSAGKLPGTYLKNLRFDYIKADGDFDFTVTLNRVDSENPKAFAGIMIRESLDEERHYAVISSHPERDGRYIYTQTSINTIDSKNYYVPQFDYPPYPQMFPGVRFRFLRADGMVNIFMANPGDCWRSVGILPMETSSCYIGLIVSSGGEKYKASAAFSAMTFNGKTLDFSTLTGLDLNCKPGKHYAQSEIHTDFKLSKSSDQLWLRDADGMLIDELEFDALRVDISYGRSPDGADNFGMFDNPTPGDSNAQAYTMICPDPEFSVDGGIYSGSQVLIFTNSDDTEIRYTLNGNAPDRYSELYVDPIYIDTTVCVRAVAYKNDQIPSETVTNTYIIEPVSKLNCVALCTDSSGLWDDWYGIHQERNIYSDKKLDAHFEYFDKSGERLYSSRNILRLHGAHSRHFPQKSFRLYAENNFDNKRFEYDFFNSDYLDKYDKILIRNSGQDWHHSFIKDALIGVLAREIPNLDAAAHRPLLFYLNGDYWGLMNLRERIDEKFLADKYDISSESINLLENEGVALNGDTIEYFAMYDRIMSTDMTKASSYILADSLIDIDNFNKYMITEIFSANIDWPLMNIKFWKSDELDGKWRWYLHDLDITLGLRFAEEKSNPLFSYIYRATNSTTSQLSAFAGKLLENPQIRVQFVNSAADMLNSVFSYDNMKQKIDSLTKLIRPEVERHREKWPESMNNYSYEIDFMKYFAKLRMIAFRINLNDNRKFGGMSDLTLLLSDSAAGSILVNSLTISTFPKSLVYFRNIPVNIVVKPNPGYEFTGWSDDKLPDSTLSNSREIELLIPKHYTLTANFKKVEIPDWRDSLVINEIMFKPADNADCGDWIEIYNNSASEIALAGMSLSDSENPHIFIIPDSIILASDSYLIICKDFERFSSQHPDIENVVHDFDFGLSASDQVRLRDKYGFLIDSVAYDSVVQNFYEAEGTGRTLELIEPNLDNANLENWKVSLTEYGTPGARNSVYVTVEEKLNFTEVSLRPNPFSSNIEIELSIENSANIEAYICDNSGRKIYDLSVQYRNFGTMRFIWNGKDSSGNEMPRGVYFVRIEIGDRVISRKCVKNGCEK